MHVTQEKKGQFLQEGYFVLENVISSDDVAELRAKCQRHMDLQVGLMEQVGAQTPGPEAFLFLELFVVKPPRTGTFWNEARPCLRGGERVAP